MRIFFATDLHGSLLCFKKFLAAKKFYGADILLLGGDLTGKGIVPIVSRGSIASYMLYGRHFECNGTDEKKKAIESIENVGFYPLEIGEPQVGGLGRTEELDHRFRECIRDQIATWDAAATKLGAHVYVIPGNDDMSYLDGLLESSRSFENCDRKVLGLLNGWSLVGFGGSNITPWKTFREFDEQYIERTIDNLMRQVKDVDRCIWNIHVPPVASNLDVCESLDERYRVITHFGQPQLHSAGSTAVGDLIRKWQPPVALFGHIHEARGFVRIGKTLCINPGSEYFLGNLNGCLIDLEDSTVTSFHLTSG
jgi:hypothetical protein